MSLFGNKKGVFTIPTEVNFLPSLAQGIEKIAQDKNLDPTDITIYLPTQRSIRAFQGFLMAQSGSKPILLPNLVPLGSLDEGDVVLKAFAQGAFELTLPPEIGSLERIFLLDQEIRKAAKSEALRSLGASQRLAVAKELAGLLDQIQNAEINAKDIETLAPETHAVHWADVLEVLKIITRVWPKTLTQKGVMDPIDRRRVLTQALIRTWKISPPKTPIIVAGSTGSVPLTREFLKAVCCLPEGAVILPGLDQTMGLDSWNEIDETHPQFTMKQTLDFLEVPRSKVEEWPFGTKGSDENRTRLMFFQKALAPAKVTTQWHFQTFDLAKVMDSFAVLECPTQRSEAGVIALALRKTLEEKGKTAALVTSDRSLALRVKSELERWEIDIDDSAGTPLPLTPPGAFFALLVETIAGGFQPVPFLGLLKHPLTTLGQDRAQLLKSARFLDRKILRGIAPGGGLKGLILKVKFRDDFQNQGELLSLLETLKEKTEPLQKALGEKRTSFAEILRLHIDTAESLSTVKNSKTLPLYSGAAGEILAKFLDDADKQGSSLEEISGADYPAILRPLMETKKLRRPFPVHPRIYIWGTLEARLQRPDLVILGGVNEGTWPAEGNPDPWMNREMKKALGLPTQEQRIGLSAHDFFQALGAKEVLITRSAKTGGAPTTESRWLQRARALLKGNFQGPQDPLLAIYEGLDTPEDFTTLKPPEPKPPLKNRPQGMSVTGIEKLMGDPYSIYARDILKLAPFDELEADPGAADKGLLLHKVFEVYFKENENRLPENALEKLIQTGEREFKKQKYTRPAIRAFWWPRFVEVARAFVETQTQKEKEFQTLGTEMSGEFVFKTQKTSFKIWVKADRIDQRGEDGQLYIIDYKTGAIPKLGDLKSGKKPQLPLEALIVKSGGFKDFKETAVAGLEFWDLGKPGATLTLHPTTKDLDKILENTERGLGALVDFFAEEKNPYLSVPDPSNHRLNDYDPLSRYHEWQNRPLVEEGKE